MFRDSHAFSGYSTDDIERARAFYGDTLGLNVSDGLGMGILDLNLAGGSHVLIYPKDDHVPATYTVLNFPVDDIDAAVERLRAAGIHMERYEGFEQDERGIARSARPEDGPPIAWFKDPAGNILAVLETGEER